MTTPRKSHYIKQSDLLANASTDALNAYPYALGAAASRSTASLATIDSSTTSKPRKRTLSFSSLKRRPSFLERGHKSSHSWQAEPAPPVPDLKAALQNLAISPQASPALSTTSTFSSPAKLPVQLAPHLPRYPLAMDTFPAQKKPTQESYFPSGFAFPAVTPARSAGSRFSGSTATTDFTDDSASVWSDPDDYDDEYEPNVPEHVLKSRFSCSTAGDANENSGKLGPLLDRLDRLGLSVRSKSARRDSPIIVTGREKSPALAFLRKSDSIKSNASSASLPPKSINREGKTSYMADSFPIPPSRSTSVRHQAPHLREHHKTNSADLSRQIAYVERPVLGLATVRPRTAPSTSTASSRVRATFI